MVRTRTSRDEHLTLDRRPEKDVRPDPQWMSAQAGMPPFTVPPASLGQALVLGPGLMGHGRQGDEALTTPSYEAAHSREPRSPPLPSSQPPPTQIASPFAQDAPGTTRHSPRPGGQCLEEGHVSSP